MTRGEMRQLLRNRLGDDGERRWSENIRLDLELNTAAVWVNNEIATHQGRDINYPFLANTYTGDGTTLEYPIFLTSGVGRVPANFIREFFCDRVDVDQPLPLTRIEEDEQAAWVGTIGAGTEPTVYYIAHRPSGVVIPPTDDPVRLPSDPDQHPNLAYYVVGFPEAPSATFKWRLQWMGYPSPIETGADFDSRGFAFLPPQHHELVVLRAAKTLLHGGDERYPSIAGDYQESLRQLYRSLSSTVHELWVEQTAYADELAPLDNVLMAPWNARRDYDL